MRYFLIVTVICAAALDAGAQLQAKFDRFKNRTELFAPSVEETMKSANLGKLTPQVLTFFEGEKPAKPPPLVRLHFRVLSRDGWKYLRCHTMAALVNGKPFDLPAAKHDGHTIRGSAVLESIYVSLDWDKFEQLSNAATAEFRVCNTELSITRRELEGWRDLIKAATP